MFRLTPELIWRSAILACRNGDPLSLATLVLGRDEIPDFARAFIADIIKTRAKKQGRGRPPRKDIVQDLAIEAIYRALTDDQGVRPGAAIEALARSSHRGKKAIERIVYKPRRPK